MINMDYLKGRLVQAKAADSDVVRIGIEEFEELIEEINEYPKKYLEAYEKGEKDMVNKVTGYVHQLRNIIETLNAGIEEVC